MKKPRLSDVKRPATLEELETCAKRCHHPVRILNQHMFIVEEADYGNMLYSLFDCLLLDRWNPATSSRTDHEHSLWLRFELLYKIVILGDNRFLIYRIPTTKKQRTIVSKFLQLM